MKSTTLRMIAGLEDITSGELWIGDKLMNDVEPKDRDIAMVFQNYALYPHMTVYENMAFSLKLKKSPVAERQAIFFAYFTKSSCFRKRFRLYCPYSHRRAALHFMPPSGKR